MNYVIQTAKLLLLAIVAIVPVAQGFADDAGWVSLSEDTKKFGSESALKSVFKTPTNFLEKFQPVGVTTESLSVDAVGPNAMPRLNFLAKSMKVNLGIIPLNVNANAWVHADAAVSPVKCQVQVFDKKTNVTKTVDVPGYRMELSFADSDATLSKYLSALAMEFCILSKDKKTGEIQVSVRSSVKSDAMSESQTYVDVAKELLAKQAYAFLDAVQRQYDQEVSDEKLRQSVLGFNKINTSGRDEKSNQQLLADLNYEIAETGKLVRLLLNDKARLNYILKLQELTAYCKTVKTCNTIKLDSDDEAKVTK